MIHTKSLQEARLWLAQALREVGLHAYEETTSKYTVHGFTMMPASHFSLSFMPGNRRTLISHAVNVETPGKGVGTKLCELREQAARKAGVTLMLATVMDSNAAEIAVLTKCGWARLTQNEQTKCSLWGKQLL